MHTLYDRFFIIIACGFLLDMKDIKHSLIVVLVALILSELNVIFDRRWLTMTLVSFYMVTCFRKPEFYCYLPLLLYDACSVRAIPLFILSFVSMGYYINKLPVYNLVCIAFITAVGVYLQRRTERLAKMKQQLEQTQDASREITMLMEDKNREVLINQDNQIHMATLQERNRIAREIHDNVGHMLSRSILMLGASIATSKDETTKETLLVLKDILSNAMNEIRSSVHDLHDESIDLKDQLKQIVDGFTFCPVEFDYDMGKHVKREVKMCFIAITKEACSNIIKHSNATKVEILAREHPGMYQLLIKDNGTNIKKQSSDGIGLSNMEDRVNGLHGRINISSEKGFQIFVMIPKTSEKNDMGGVK